MFLLLGAALLTNCNQSQSSENKGGDKQLLTIKPIEHATLVIEYGDLDIYVDPVGEQSLYAGLRPADIVLVTDIHGDHLNVETLRALKRNDADLIVPQAVNDRFRDSMAYKIHIMNNGDQLELNKDELKVSIEAIPMYNLREEALQFHTKGRGNGYILTLGEKRVYISGDTEDISEMRTLKDIDIAFVCMNLPWTMPVESAASAVLDFKPVVVYPYHYRGRNGLSDVGRFKNLVEAENSKIDVRLLNWYPER